MSDRAKEIFTAAWNMARHGYTSTTLEDAFRIWRVSYGKEQDSDSPYRDALVIRQAEVQNLRAYRTRAKKAYRDLQSRYERTCSQRENWRNAFLTERVRRKAAENADRADDANHEYWERIANGRKSDITALNVKADKLEQANAKLADDLSDMREERDLARYDADCYENVIEAMRERIAEVREADVIGNHPEFRSGIRLACEIIEGKSND